MQLEGVRGVQLQLGPWLADSMVACFPNLHGFTIHGLGLRLDQAVGVLTRPALSSQLTHVDISTVQVLHASPTQVAAFVQASLSLHSLHVSSRDQLQVSLRDAPCSWRTLLVGNMESTTVSKLPLHAVTEAVHIGCLTVSTVYHPLAAVTAMATSFADGVLVRPQVDVLNLSVFVATENVDAYIAALQPLNGCFDQLQACWGDAWNNKPFDVAAVAAVAPLCGGIHTLGVKYALLQSSPQLWQFIVDDMPSITEVHFIQCNHGWPVDDLREGPVTHVYRVLPHAYRVLRHTSTGFCRTATGSCYISLQGSAAQLQGSVTHVYRVLPHGHRVLRHTSTGFCRTATGFCATRLQGSAARLQGPAAHVYRVLPHGHRVLRHTTTGFCRTATGSCATRLQGSAARLQGPMTHFCRVLPHAYRVLQVHR
ncbi:hypothetical protein V8C86DRAFT_2444167 [Haematococcus lacustris]